MNGENRAGRHKRPGPIDVVDGLRHRLGHIRSRMKEQLHQGSALNVPGLDVVDSRDVEKMVLVIVGQIAFHLRRVHAAIRLSHIDHRQVQAGKDVDSHLPNRQKASQRTPANTTITVIGRRKAKRINLMEGCSAGRFTYTIIRSPSRQLL